MFGLTVVAHGKQSLNLQSMIQAVILPQCIWKEVTNIVVGSKAHF